MWNQVSIYKKVNVVQTCDSLNAKKLLLELHTYFICIKHVFIV